MLMQVPTGAVHTHSEVFTVTSSHVTPPEVDDQRANGVLMRVGALAGIGGAVLQVWLGGLHAGHSDPNNSAHVFEEYAVSDIWTLVHIGQYVGAFLIIVALMALYRSLGSERGVARAMASIGMLASVAVLAVFAVQMAVDGIALREAVRTWVEAPTPADRSAAFMVAESVRWLEKGLSGIFHLNNGMAMLSFGLAIAAGRTYARWIGAFAIVAGVSFIAGGVVTAHSGFSMEAATVLSPASLGLAAFILAIGVAMWRRAGTPQARLAPREVAAGA